MIMSLGHNLHDLLEPNRARKYTLLAEYVIYEKYYLRITRVCLAKMFVSCKARMVL